MNARERAAARDRLARARREPKAALASAQERIARLPTPTADDEPPVTVVDDAGKVLSKRELQVLRLIADGLSNDELASRLGLSVETVKSHIRHILAKLVARSRAHAVALAYRRGYLTVSASELESAIDHADSANLA